MGLKLASEVKEFIEDNCPSNTLGRISFIGHSLGGIIIRSGLESL
jgi:predicted alpha/beta superfamily hydrolase